MDPRSRPEARRRCTGLWTGKLGPRSVKFGLENDCHTNFLNQTSSYLVALHVSPHVSSHQCQMRYIRSHDPALNKSAWTSDEDARLNTLIGVLGTSDWTDIARHMPGRTNDMCRERYTEGRKGKGKVTSEGEGEIQVSNQGREATEKAGTSRRTDWTEEQDMELIRLAGELGSKWQKISEAMGGLHNNNQVYFYFAYFFNRAGMGNGFF